MQRGESASWLCPSELDRSRMVDASPRVRTIRLIGVVSVGMALLATAPWVGWWVLLPFALAAVNLATVERRIATSARPERVSAWAILTTLAILGIGVALSGGPHSPALPWMVLPAAIAAARFRPRVVAAALTITIAAILLSTLALHPQATIAYPVQVIATLALLAGVVSIVWALQAAELHHREEAIFDPLTGLLNRHALLPRFAELSQQARVAHDPICLLLCDIDGFKAINDRYGHDRGDAVLRDIAYELRKRLRSFELIYRLGGEEFLIILPGIGEVGGLQIAERLRDCIERAQPTGIHTTISLGLSTGHGERLEYEPLFKAADEALYEAKRAGRNRVACAPDSSSLERERADVLEQVLLATVLG